MECAISFIITGLIAKFNTKQMRLLNISGTSGMTRLLRSTVFMLSGFSLCCNWATAQTRLAPRKGDTTITFISTDIARNSIRQIATQTPSRLKFIDLWATWCVPCLEAMPTSDSLYQALLKQGVQLIYVSFDKEEDDALWRKVVLEKQIHGVHVRASKALQDDITIQIWKGIDVYSIPHYMIVDSIGTVVAADAPSSKNTEAFNAALKGVGR